MQARSATLPDAISIEQLIQVHVADGTLLPRYAGGDLREHSRLRRGRARRRNRRLRRAASVRNAPGRNPLHHRDRQSEGQRSRPQCWLTPCYQRQSARA